jgi:hypothetical protein
VLQLCGFAWAQEMDTFLSSDAPTQEMELEWCAKTSMHQHSPLFKRTDIEALAAKINSATEYAAEANDLRQQLEQVREALKAAEAELLEHRDEDGRKNLDHMRHALMHDHKEGGGGN